MDASTTTWEASLPDLRERFPSATDGILFCVHKLSENSELTIPDFRDEASLHGIKLGGRALHSARILLGHAQPEKRRRAVPRSARTDNGNRITPANGSAADFEAGLIEAIQQIQDQATAETRRLREAIQKAVVVLNEALD